MNVEELDQVQNNVLNYQNAGMSKRFYAACMAMQGLIAGCDVYSGGFDPEWVTKAAFSMADKLLKQENL